VGRLLSINRRAINWRTVGVAMVVQVAFAVLRPWSCPRPRTPPSPTALRATPIPTGPAPNPTRRCRVPFTDFGPRVEELSDKTVAVVAFALCGFANFGSFAILLGGLAQIAPKRRGSVARFGVRAVLADTLANFLNAAVAGMFV
jgi:nucleoside permease NupC